MDRRRARHGRSSGQVLVVFALATTSILAVIGLLYTFGLVLGQRRSMQTAADAASLRGSWSVLGELDSDNLSDTVVLGSLLAYATANGVVWNGTVGDTTLTAIYVDATGAAVVPAKSVGSGGVFPFNTRGVRVTVNKLLPTILPGFVSSSQIGVQDAAGATARPTVSPLQATLVLPIAASALTVQTAYLQHAQYDLFAHPLPGSVPPTLNLAASGAPGYGTSATNAQYWSDGQHTTAWQLSQPSTVSLMGTAFYDSIAAGLSDNVRRQGLVDATGAAYALVTVPVYDTSTATTVHVVGYAQLKIRAADITAISAHGLFVPYAAAAWGAPVTPATDTGAALVGLSP